MSWRDGDGYFFRTAACVACVGEKERIAAFGGDVIALIETSEPVGRSKIDGSMRCALHLWTQRNGAGWMSDADRERLASGAENDDPEALEELLQAQIERGAIPNDEKTIAEIRQQLLDAQIGRRQR